MDVAAAIGCKLSSFRWFCPERKQPILPPAISDHEVRPAPNSTNAATSANSRIADTATHSVHSIVITVNAQSGKPDGRTTQARVHSSRFLLTSSPFSKQITTQRDEIKQTVFYRSMSFCSFQTARFCACITLLPFHRRSASLGYRSPQTHFPCFFQPKAAVRWPGRSA